MGRRRGNADSRHESNPGTPERRSEGEGPPGYAAHCKTLTQSIAPGLREMRDDADLPGQRWYRRCTARLKLGDALAQVRRPLMVHCTL